MVENSFRISSPAGWPKRSLIDLKWSMSKISTVTGRPALRLALDHPRRRLGKSAAIEHARQRIHRGRGLVHRHRALRHQHEDDEHGADRIEHELDREDRHPDAAAERLVLRAQEVAEQDRQHQHHAMQHRHHDRGPALLQRPSPLGPQFRRRQRRIDRDNAGADRHAQRGRLRRQRHDGRDPGDRAEHEPGPVGIAAMKHPRRVPDHAAGDEAGRVQRQREHPAKRCLPASAPASVHSATDTAPSR